MDDDNNEEDKIGYCRPPKHTRFTSENQPVRRGRKAGARGIKTELKALWGRKVGVKIDGVPTKQFPLRTVFDVQLQQALKGKERSFANLMELTLRTIGADDLDESARRLGVADAADLDAFLEAYVADRQAAQTDAPIDGILAQAPADEAENGETDDIA